MPELPEVETIRITLTQEIKGKTIGKINILEPKQFFGDPQDVIDKKLIDITRKGKYLSIQLSNNIFMNIHLKMSGQVIYVENINNPVIKNNIPRLNTNKLPVKSTRIIIEFTDHSAIFFNDMRKFGWIKLTDKAEGPSSPDVISKEFTEEYFLNSLKNSKLPIKVFLLDQTKLAGVGNIYANDALWEAKIHPTRKAGELTQTEGKKLYDAVVETIQTGIKYKGSSSKDENYIMPDGTLGGYQNHFKVYSKEGKECPRDKSIIKRIKQGGRSSFFCSTCQK